MAGMPSAVSTLGKPLRHLTAPWIGRFRNPKYAGLAEYSGSYPKSYLLRRALFMPWELTQFMSPAEARQALEELSTLKALTGSIGQIRDPLLKVSMLEAQWFMRHQLLRDSDWASMAHSLELRVPLVDLALWKETVALRFNDTEAMTKLDMARTPRKPMPDAILYREKSGFSVPVADWLAKADAEQTQTAPMPGLRKWSMRVYERWLKSVQRDRAAPVAGSGAQSENAVVRSAAF